MPRHGKGRKIRLVHADGKEEVVTATTEKALTPPWARMFYETFAGLAGSHMASPQLRVLAAIVGSVDWSGKGLIIDASAKKLAAKASVPMSTLYLCVSQLEDMGIIVRKPKPWRVSPFFFFYGANDEYSSTLARHQMRIVK